MTIFHHLKGQHQLPTLFNNPFSYTPHPLCLLATEEIKQLIAQRREWDEEVSKGKMFGVLIVKNELNELGYLAAYSGQIGGRSNWEGFVPAVFDYLHPQGYFKQEEYQISEINRHIGQLLRTPEYIEAQKKIKEVEARGKQEIAQHQEKMRDAKARRDQERLQATPDAKREEERLNESRFMKAELRRIKQKMQQQLSEANTRLKAMDDEINALKEERKQRSDALQRWLFAQFVMRNGKGEERNLLDIFATSNLPLPPAGTGECCAPKLLQYAFTHRFTPICMAEFWMGESPKTEIRREGYFYAACQGKCRPTLEFMLQGLKVAPLDWQHTESETIEVVYEDDHLLVVNKPAGMLSVPGKSKQLSMYDLVCRKYAHKCAPLIVHRLDMATSGLLMMAKTKECHQLLQKAFAQHTIEKMYIAKLDGCLPKDRTEGIIDLPLSLDYMDRPRQRVDKAHGKRAVTRYRVIQRTEKHTYVALYPQTGRTHQLRVHCAHAEGLNTPIVGDLLYGTPQNRLYLHAQQLVFEHPITHQSLHIVVESEDMRLATT